MITKPIRPDNFEDLPTLEKMAIEIEEFQKEISLKDEKIMELENKSNKNI